MKILFLLPVPSQPRYHKRIRGLQAEGCETVAMYFSRRYFKGDALPCEAYHLGEVGHKSYFKRIHSLIRSIPLVRKMLRQHDVIYAFGLDMALLGKLTGIGMNKKLVYEVGDIRPVQLARGLKGRVTRRLDRWIAREASDVVVTAKGYFKEYYLETLKLSRTDFHLIENHLDLSPEKRPFPQPYRGNRSIAIGYFGLIRCVKSLEVLKALTNMANGKMKVFIYGYGLHINIEQEVRLENNIIYYGEYQSPRDLPEMYSRVDLIWGCYTFPESQYELNWKWARTNRFYESCYFRKPMIALSGSDEAKEVASLGMGVSVDLSNPRSAAKQLCRSIPLHLQQWQEAAMKVPDEKCVYTSEHKKLASALTGKMSS